ncbi:MAG: AMP-binding protein [Gammaproteobacteria bacterium]|nr:AMP-binding protein [Gammaproteobacteria bacterium]
MILHSPLPAVDIPELSLPAYALERARQYGERAAFIDAGSGRALSFDALAEQVERVAAGFASQGMVRGDVLAVCLPNLPEFAVAVYAATTLGAVVTTINPLYTAEELARQLNDAGAKYFLTLTALWPTHADALASTPVVRSFVIGDGAPSAAVPWAQLLACSDPVPRVDVDPARDLAVLPYSSGTTGLPKGVMLTHRALVANSSMVIDGPNPIGQGEVFACVPPMFHIYGIATYLATAMRLGCTVVCMPRFDFEAYVRVLATYRATFAVVVPPVALGLVHHPIVDSVDLSALRIVVSSAAPLAPALATAMAKRLGARVVQGYGMTEVAGASHAQREGDPPESVGVALPNIEWKVAEVDSGAALGIGETGEVCVRGPSVMSGYLGNPDATAATIDADGWLHTGDIGYADADGRCFIVDRLKELIKYKGYQIAPAELEAVLLAHPAVADAGVIGLPDDEAGEVPKAFVVKRGEVDAAALQAHVAEHVAPYKRIRDIEFVESLPKSPAGKLLRRELRALAAARP